MDIDGVDFLEREVCLICNESEGESLLVCCVTGCPISLHRKCLRQLPKFGESGNFYCPYCWFKRADAKARELRKKALLKRKELSEFIAGNVGGNDKGKGDLSQQANEDCLEEQGGGNDQCGVSGENGMDTEPPVGGDGADTCRHGRDGKIPSIGADSHVRDQKLSRTSGIGGNEKRPFEKKDQDGQVDGEANVRSTKETKTNNKLHEDSVNDEAETNVSSRRVSRRNISVMSDSDSEENEVLMLRLRRIVKQKKLNKGEVQQNAAKSPGMLNQKSNSKNEKASPAKASGKGKETTRRVEKILSNGKRKPLFWTAEEEDMLREGMARFSSNEVGRTPWTMILDIGRSCGVFDKSRTPLDLKDKWKTMKRKEMKRKEKSS